MKAHIMIILALLSGLGLILQASQNQSTETHKEWRELVDPIITPTERNVFNQLQTDREKDLFIRTFWKRRDPLPDTQANEFYNEYMERVRFADYHFGRESHKQGHLTERGRFYLVLGAPLEREIYATQSELNPLELWRYKGEQEYGLPAFFYLIFYQDRGMGEYRLYSPEVEGPEKLLAPTVLDQATNRNQAFRLIRTIAGDLARASLSYIPGESTVGVTPLSSGNLIAKIQSLPDRKYSDSYARQFLNYKDFVETDYSHEFIESRHLIKIFRHQGREYIHWSLEPSRMNFGQYEGKNYAVYQLNIRLEDMTGSKVFEIEEEIPLQITPEQYQRHAGKLFAFQDLLPIAPGDYRIFFLIRNKTGKEFSSFDRQISITGDTDQPAASSLLVYQSRETAAGKGLKAFSFGGSQYLINTQNNCLRQSMVGVYFQIFGIDSPEAKTLSIRLLSLDSQQPVEILRKPLREFLQDDGIGVDTGTFALAEVIPGYYKLEATVINPDGSLILTASENLIVLEDSIPVVPWTYAKMHSPAPNFEHLFILASQYFMTAGYEEAEAILRELQQRKDDARVTLMLGRSLFARGKYQDSLELLLPLNNQSIHPEAAKIIAADYAGLKEWESALPYLEKLLQNATELGVLNLAAECRIRLNQPELALPLLEKSLQIDPEQAKIKEWRDRIKNQTGPPR